MEGNGTATAHLFYAALLRVKVVLPRSTGNYLAFLGDTEALGIRLVRFHITTALLRGGDSMPERGGNARLFLARASAASLSAATAAALPLGPSACATRRKIPFSKSL